MVLNRSVWGWGRGRQQSRQKHCNSTKITTKSVCVTVRLRAPNFCVTVSTVTQIRSSEFGIQGDHVKVNTKAAPSWE